MRTCLTATLVVAAALSMHGVAEAQTLSDPAARTTVFGSGFLAENAMSVRHKAARLEVDDKYQFLLKNVLPSGSNSSLRMSIVLTPLNSPLASDERPNTNTTKVQTGGQLASPFLELVEVANELDRLKEVRTRIEQALAESSHDQIARSAALAIVDCSTGETASAVQNLAKIFEIVSASRESREESEAALLLAIFVGAKHAETRQVASDLAYSLHEVHLDLVKPNDWRPYHRHVAALANELSNALSQEVNDSTDETDALTAQPAEKFSEWQSGSLFTAESRGTGCPPNVWNLESTSVRKTSGHNIDLLYFQSPLRGDFEFECDASVFNWRSIHPTYGGHWAGVEPQRTRRRIGTLAELDSELLPLDSKLSKFRHEIHYRVSVRGQQMELYGNGRLLNSVTLPEDHDPWLALRRSAKHSARIWNVRITGQPEIPDELRLSESPNLEGWIPYFGESPADVNVESSHWRQAGNNSTGQLIAGRKEARLPPGSHDERLLYYHRPMLEDGTIEYKFFYKTGQSTVHPAMDRAAFLLDPDGVKLHWVTDGKFDRSALSPGNTTVELDNRRGPQRLPLKEDDWNSARLTLVGDTVSLFLNDVQIYERRLEASNQRNFGLFHYADRSQAVVKDVVWRGGWPKHFPLMYDQELAGSGTRDIDLSASKLPETFRHSFKGEQFPLGKFALSEGEMSDTRSGSDGIYVQRRGEGRYKRTTLATQLAIGGDFDIQASFDSLVTEPCDGGHSSLSVLIRLADKDATQTNYRRRHNRYDGREDQHLAYADVASFPKDGPRRTNIGYKPAESTSGTLRVARRGNRLYTLFAEGESKNFRITAESEFPTDDTQLGGVLVSAMTYKESFVSLRWKELVIRAERITGPAVGASAPVAVLADLDKKRAVLPVAGDFDFAKKAPSNLEFYQWGTLDPWNARSGGQKMSHVGRPNWAASGITPRGVIAGDFDITAVFDLEKIVNPTVGDRSTVYLKSIFGPTGQTQASLMFEVNPEGARKVYARLGTRKPGGGHNYRAVGSVATKEISVLRIARYGTSMYFLARRDMSSSEHLIGIAQVSDEPVSGRAMNFMVHSGGEGRETHVLLKSLKIRANKFTAANIPIRLGAKPPRNSPPASRGFFDRVIDLFK